MTTEDTITEIALREHLGKVMDDVCESDLHMVITREGKPPVVMLSLAELRSIEETMYLMSSPANAEHLIRSIAQLNAGLGVEDELVEPEEIGSCCFHHPKKQEIEIKP